ncbi:MAG: orotate phosphoribosyltransferase [Desulfobacca sp.]|uniref:orotate phosphoribosyltransferase n=1 Tax=Desulfobacca sp. TaxID=2067990 RepID=UPI00404B209F
MLREKKQKLLTLLHRLSYSYCENPPFTLASGRQSPFYIDGKKTTHHAEGKFLVGELIYDLVKDRQIAAIGGLTMGADPMAVAASLISYLHGQPIHSFSVRKATKDHGTRRRIEGPVQPGDRVVIVDDVITTGASLIEAIQVAKDYGLEVVAGIVLVDREEGGAENIRKYLPDLLILCTVSELSKQDAQPQIT